MVLKCFKPQGVHVAVKHDMAVFDAFVDYGQIAFSVCVRMAFLSLIPFLRLKPPRHFHVGTIIAPVREPILSVGQFTGFRRNVD